MSTSSVASPTAHLGSPPTNPTRNRHRGLNYLRSYTHSRLSLNNHNNSTNQASPTGGRSHRISLHRTHSYPPQLAGLPAAPQSAQGAASGENGEPSPYLLDSTPENTAVPAGGQGTADMGRNKVAGRSGTFATAATDGTRATLFDGASEEIDESGPPTIRFYPHQELPNGRPSLHFPPIVRILPSASSIIKVGRYSEREGIPVSNPTTPSDAPVGFKSKVVSRKHCEFSFSNGSWQIKDVASSSGTFLNHVRLSQPNQVSRPFPVKDGDVVQLGIDFRGGEEMIFRCVKIRVECNRTWQQKPNKYNQQRHAQLVHMKPEGAAPGVAGAGENTGECSICLSSVMPCQSLFVAPCAHVWHFKCIYPLLIGKRYPNFTCPNCRAIWNLEAEVDDGASEGEWENAGHASDGPNGSNEAHDTTVIPVETSLAQDTQHTGGAAGELDADNDTSMVTGNLSLDEDSEPVSVPRIPSSGLLSRRQASSGNIVQANATGALHDINLPDVGLVSDEVAHYINRVHSPVSAAEILSGEGPLTPRNDAGPFVFDGSAGRPGSRRSLNVSSGNGPNGLSP